MSVKIILVTFYFWTVTAICTLLTGIICLICYPFVDQLTFSIIFEKTIGYSILYCMTIPNIWSFKITDRRSDKNKNKKINKKYVIIANHCSFIDTLLMGNLPITKKFIMAEKFTYVPIFGWICKLAGHIAVNPRNPESLKNAIIKSKEVLKETSLLIYPEGKRSDNPYQLLKLKTGAFRIAQSTNTEILPITLIGTGKAMHIGGICYPADLEIIINDSFEISDDPEDKKIESRLMEAGLMKGKSIIQTNLNLSKISNLN